MLKRKHVILAGAVAAVLPALSHAATISMNWDTTVSYWSNAAETAGTGTAQIVGNTVTIPSGDYFTLGASATVSNNVNPASNSGTSPQNTYSKAAASKAQPVNLGIGLFSLGITTSSLSHVAPVGADLSTAPNQDSQALVASAFTPATAGWIQSNGTVGENDGATPPFFPGSSNVSDPVSGTINTPGANAATATGKAAVSYAGGASAELFTGLMYKATGNATLTPTFDTNNTGVATYLSGGTTTTQVPAYGSRTLTATEIQNSSFLPALSIISGSVTTASPQIISLTSSAATGVSQVPFVGTSNPSGPTIGTNVVNVVGSGNNWKRGELNGITGGTAGVAEVKFENAAGTASDPGTEYIGLNVADTNGAQGSTAFLADIQALINDINNASTGFGSVVAYATSTTTTGDSLAGAPAGTQIAALGLNAGKVGAAQYDVVIGVPSVGGGDSFLGLNLGADAANLSSLSVTDIAAVPEPASAAGLLIGASGLLLGRRKRKA